MGVCEDRWRLVSKLWSQREGVLSASPGWSVMEAGDHPCPSGMTKSHHRCGTMSWGLVTVAESPWEVRREERHREL